MSGCSSAVAINTRFLSAGRRVRFSRSIASQSTASRSIATRESRSG
jgi:hypothetical protein